MWAGRIRPRLPLGHAAGSRLGAWSLVGAGVIAGCTMDSSPAGTMNSTLADGGRLDASSTGDERAADAADRDATARATGDGASLGAPQDGSYECVGQSTTRDACTEFLLNPAFQAKWSLRLSSGELDIVTAGFDLNQISCTGQLTGDTFVCFATMHVNGAICDDQLHLRPTGSASAVFWMGEDTDPPPVQARCQRIRP